MPRSPYDPGAEPPGTLRGRVGRRVRRVLEPLALHLVDWCRALDGRVGGVERAVGLLEMQGRGQEKSLYSAVDEAERRAGLVASRVDHGETRLALLEGRADLAYWGREALVERCNAADARDEILIDRLAAVEGRVDRLNWGREALVERANVTDARADVVVRRIERVTDRVDEHLPMPLAFAMDALAMGRRLAALEDQVERLTRQLAGDGDLSCEGGPSVVAFPCQDQDKAAG